MHDATAVHAAAKLTSSGSISHACSKQARGMCLLLDGNAKLLIQLIHALEVVLVGHGPICIVARPEHDVHPLVRGGIWEDLTPKGEARDEPAPQCTLGTQQGVLAADATPNPKAVPQGLAHHLHKAHHVASSSACT